MDPGGNGTDTLVPAARLLLRTLRHRVALVALEVEEARAHVLATGVALGIATLCCALTGVALTLVVAALFWDTSHRVSALVLLCIVYAGAAIAAVLRLRRAWKAWQPFEVTNTALQEDLRWLRRTFGDDDEDED